MARMVRGTDVAEPVEKPDRDNRNHDVNDGSGTAPGALWCVGFFLHHLLLRRVFLGDVRSGQRHYREAEKWSQAKNPGTH